MRTLREHPADRAAEAAGARDELVGAEPADQLLVAPGGDPDGPQPAQPGELDRIAAECACRPGDQQPLAGRSASRSSACAAVRAFSGSVAASAAGSPRGAGATASLSSTT